MCGFLSSIYKKNFDYSVEEFKANLNLINYRGPDYTGYEFFNDEKFFFKFGHKRLSIIDLSNNGNQPMISNQNSILIYNGEIYNHLKLRKIIDKKISVKWKGSSDTETLLYFLENFETSYVLNNLQGMFSFIFYDLNKKQLILSRDFAGEKPLYIQTCDKYISFASDIKSLSNFSKFDKKINSESMQNYLKYSYIPYPLSIYENIFKLPPASFIRINLNEFNFLKCRSFDQFIALDGIEFVKYENIENFALENKYEIKHSSIESITNQADDLITQSVNQQLLSDAPLGAFLSGGIDSSLIVSIASKLRNNIDTFTVGFDYQHYDESKYANEVSKHLNTNHHTYFCSKKDTLDIIPSLYDSYSEPFADSSQIPTLLISQIASNKVKVALSGDGGDELFGGYNRYLFANKYWHIINFLPYNIRNFIIEIFEKIPKHLQIFILNSLFFRKHIGSSSKHSKFLEKIKTIENKYSFYDSMVNIWNNQKISSNNDTLIKNNYFNLFNQFENKKLEEIMMLADFVSYLPDDILCKVDRASMYYSLETRSPFLNKEIIEFAYNLDLKYKINKGKTKYLLKNILNRYLPEKLFERPKMGFGIPLGNWLNNELRDYMRDNLSKNVCDKHNFFNYDLVTKTIDDHISGNSNNDNKLWNLIQFNNWYLNNF